MQAARCFKTHSLHLLFALAIGPRRIGCPPLRLAHAQRQHLLLHLREATGQEGASTAGRQSALLPKHTLQAAHRTAAVAASKVRQGGVGQPGSSPRLLQLLWEEEGGVQPPAHDRGFGPVGDGVLRFGCMEWETRSWMTAGQQRITATSACCTAKQSGRRARLQAQHQSAPSHVRPAMHSAAQRHVRAAHSWMAWAGPAA